MKLAATIIYRNECSADKIYYPIMKISYHEEDTFVVTGLHVVAFGVLFPVKVVDSCEEIKIQEWPTAL